MIDYLVAGFVVSAFAFAVLWCLLRAASRV